MAILAIFSIWSWAIFLKKLFDFSKIKKMSKRFMSTYRFHQHTKELENMGPLLNDNPYGRILRNGLEEFGRLKAGKRISSPEQNPHGAPGLAMEELSDNIRLAMERTKISEIAEMERSLPALGTFVSVSPFLGLLGTVWGIMQAFAVKTKGLISEMNMTSLADVSITLLVIFMITAPMMTPGIDVNLPRTDASLPHDEEGITVSIKNTGDIYIDTEKVALEDFERVLKKNLESKPPSVIVYLRADEKIDYGYAIEIIGRMRKAGVRELGLIADIPLE
jgi:biopolymer transport protein TolR